MKVNGSDWQERVKKTDEQNKAENEIVKKGLYEVHNTISELLEFWDKWHLLETEQQLFTCIKDIDSWLKHSFELQDPDSDVLRLIYCLGHSKIVIQEYVKDGITRDELINSFKKGE